MEVAGRDKTVEGTAAEGIQWTASGYSHPPSELIGGRTEQVCIKWLFYRFCRLLSLLADALRDKEKIDYQMWKILEEKEGHSLLPRILPLLIELRGAPLRKDTSE